VCNQLCSDTDIVFVKNPYPFEDITSQKRIQINMGICDCFEVIQSFSSSFTRYDDDLDVDTHKKMNTVHHERILSDINSRLGFGNNQSYTRWMIREYFEEVFRKPQEFFYLERQQEIKTYQFESVLNVDIRDFYSYDRFMSRLNDIAQWAGITSTDTISISSFNDFKKRQTYLGSRRICDSLIKNIISKYWVHVPNMKLVCEAYINVELENHTGNQSPRGDNQWFKSIDEIWSHYGI
jgi:hypothetical protein